MLYLGQKDLTTLKILDKCLGLIQRGFSLAGSRAYLLVNEGQDVGAGQDWCLSPVVHMWQNQGCKNQQFLAKESIERGS